MLVLGWRSGETSRLLAAPESIFDANEIVRLSTIRECEMLLENRMTKALFLAARSRELEEVSRDLDQLSRLQRERALKFTVLPCEIPFIAHNNSRVPAVVRVLITSTADFDLSDGWSVQLLLRAPQGKSQLPAPFQVVSQPIWHVSPTSWWETSVDLDLALFPHFVIAELSLVRRSTAESFLSVVAKTVQLSMLDFVVPCPRQYRSVQGQLRAASSSELATQSLRFKVSPTRDFQRAVLAHLLCTKFSQKERLSQILVTSSLGFLMFPGYTQFATVSFHCAEQNVAENVASRETAIPAEIRIRSISEKLATKLAIMLALRVVEVQHEGSDLAGISMGWLDLVDLPALRAGISEFVLTIE
ncbi:hypothetical protein DFJ73DRAFT_305673 [Zopfochytrium polystomum]|nr:hypothetical protein DFJ73DRAFT_305673 [Zopfochytrium polystomum]